MTSRSSLSILLQGEQSISLVGFSPTGFPQHRGTPTDDYKRSMTTGNIPSYILLATGHFFDVFQNWWSLSKKTTLNTFSSTWPIIHSLPCT